MSILKKNVKFSKLGSSYFDFYYGGLKNISEERKFISFYINSINENDVDDPKYFLPCPDS